jgi:VWFA-related protein
MTHHEAVRATRDGRTCFVAACALVLLTVLSHAQPPQPPTVFRSNTELVVVSVVARDKDGKVVRGLTREDFTISEDDRPQVVTSFDFEELDAVADEVSEPSPILSTTPVPRPDRAGAAVSPPIDMHGRRLIVLFFDLSSMQPEELTRSVGAARDYVDHQLSPSDAIAVVSFATALRVDQDFTHDRTLLLQAFDRFGPVGGQGFDEGAAGSADGTPDNGAAFTPDDTEFNVFNTDRRLDALRSLSESLSGIQQKKSVIYFSSGMSQSGQDNQVELRRTIDRAKRANVSIYAADMRGLQAIVPGGDASQASVRGAGAFSGASVTSQFTKLASTQDTLTTIAEDTGGRAFFDTNTFGSVFQRVVADTSAYYLLGYSSTNPARDGRYRRIKVTVKRPDVKLEYRSGYYASRDFAHLTKNDREQQLQDQMTADLSATDVSAFVSASYFRLADNRYFVPLSVAVPGYQLPVASAADRSRATLDILGLVRDQRGRPVGRVRDAVRLPADSGGSLARKIVQYETALQMPPGVYHLKFVVRENIAGAMGSYETDFVVPDVKSEPVRMSSIVMGTQWQAGVRTNPDNPLLHDGRELVPNITHVVSPEQHLYFYYEVYDPTAASSASATRSAPPVHLLTSVAFFRGRVRAFETPPIDVTTSTGNDGKKAVFQFDVPAASLTPGLYTCQVNVVDDVSGTYAFPRFQLYVRR